MNQKKFEPTLQSLEKYECPEWFSNAKFGIWSHWGPQSVPMCGDWYARNMYIQGSDQYSYHVRHYGHPSKFGYKDICALWKADSFDPEGLMELYYKAGARYFVGQAMHHDHFFNYPSKLNRFNSMQIGPKKDIIGLWKAAAEKYNLPFGFSEHLGASFTWWKTNKWSDTYGPYAGIPYDGNDPEYRDFYLDNYEHAPEGNRDANPFPWYTTNEKFKDYWLSVMKESIDLYKPDLLYSDGFLPFSPHFPGSYRGNIDDVSQYKWGLEAVSYLYNTSIEKYGKNNAVYNQKDREEKIYKIGVLDIEKSQLPGINPYPWQTDTCIGNWFYDAKQKYKKPDQIIEILVDIVSKNGCMLLNILQRPDGSIDDEARFILEELAKWYAICGDSIYGTRPWRQYGEGDTLAVIKDYTENKTTWNSSDYRFTVKDDKLYAFILKPADNRIAVIKSLREEETVKSIKLLGVGSVPFTQSYGVLTVKLPDILPTKYTNCLEIVI